MSNYPKITFGLIVFNGEPFTRYCLRSLYPFAHQIIVVEGAVRAAADLATANGHSVDGTLDVLQRFKQEEDPDNKIEIITAKGFWSEKEEMSQAYAQRATGNYLWQVDVDEFYKPQDMQAILEMLRSDSKITAVSFKQITFFGGFDYVVDGWLFREKPAKYWAQRYHRLFKWGPGYRYIDHRPPTVCNPEGVDLRNLKWVNGDSLIKKGIFLYHYSLVFPKQVLDKSRYYDQAKWAQLKGFQEWYQKIFLGLESGYRVHNVYNYPAWLERFSGQHPPEIKKMIKDVNEGIIQVERRKVDDIEHLLGSPRYWLGKKFFKLWGFINRLKRAIRRTIKKQLI
ncbi:MAG: glycosyltransferase family 2 protein [Candidatus Omnitrophica bacterium]|nr:glycosyltransferase family 2 protein [Candidatus Omnitrophota bacterium]